MCFVAVAFWNMLGAGVFGFMIDTPVALFYLQGLNTTAVQAHAALFGVYGFLSLGFVLLVLRYLRPDMLFNVGAAPPSLARRQRYLLMGRPVDTPVLQLEPAIDEGGLHATQRA